MLSWLVFNCLQKMEFYFLRQNGRVLMSTNPKRQWLKTTKGSLASELEHTAVNTLPLTMTFNLLLEVLTDPEFELNLFLN